MSLVVHFYRLEQRDICGVVVHGSDHPALVLLVGGPAGVVHVLPLESGQLSTQRAENGVPGADVPLLDQGRVDVYILIALDHLPGLEAGPARGGDVGLGAELVLGDFVDGASVRPGHDDSENEEVLEIRYLLQI